MFWSVEWLSWSYIQQALLNACRFTLLGGCKNVLRRPGLCVESDHLKHSHCDYLYYGEYRVLRAWIWEGNQKPREGVGILLRCKGEGEMRKGVQNSGGEGRVGILGTKPILVEWAKGRWLTKDKVQLSWSLSSVIHWLCFFGQRSMKTRIPMSSY